MKGAVPEAVPGWDRTRIAEAVSPMVEAELDGKQISERSLIGLLKLILTDDETPAEAAFRLTEDRYETLLRKVARKGFVMGFLAAAQAQAPENAEPGQ